MKTGKKYVFARPSNGKILSALLIMAITLGIMAAVYSIEYSINIHDRAKLEQEVGDYFFTEEMEAHVLAGEKSGRTLYLLFEREGCRGIYGLAELEQGVLGRYRIARADLSNWPLYQGRVIQAGKQNRLLIYGYYTLPGVDSYRWYGSVQQHGEPGFVGSAETGPFMRMVDLPAGAGTASLWTDDDFSYLDAQGNVLDVDALEAQMPTPADVNCPSVGSEGAGVLGLFLIPIFLGGFWLAWVQLFGKKQGYAQDIE